MKSKNTIREFASALPLLCCLSILCLFLYGSTEKVYGKCSWSCAGLFSAHKCFTLLH